jgi:acyl-CoA reductase-like NAD-dependent aldehyde dehydrogenase
VTENQRDKIFIDGSWVASGGTGTLEVTNAATEQVMGTVPDGVAADVDKAVAAAKAAFPGWSATSREERGKYLTRISEELAARTDEIATVISQEVGMPFWLAKPVQVGMPAATFGSQAGYLDALNEEEKVGNAIIAREPVGVVGAITPWNYPLHQVAAKVGPALAAGNTVVLKPSEVAPLSAFILAEIVESVGLPAGVFNLVSGVGPVVGEAIASHADVDMVSFTGSTLAGKRVMELASQTVKRVALELGGKSPLVVMPDADPAAAAARAVQGCYINSGQTCSALTRMVAPRSKLAEIEAAVTAAVEQVKTGDPFEEGVFVGPLITQRQWDRVQSYIKLGTEEGARVIVGGEGKPEGLETGYFVKPTVFSDVTPKMRIAQEEIFGPVLVIEPYDDSDGVEDAVRIANDTQYGLAGGVFGTDADAAMKVARRIRAGQVEVNGGAFNPFAPFGGYKQSGIGRELGHHGLDEFLETKAVLT